jgi:putative membrane protein
MQQPYESMPPPAVQATLPQRTHPLTPIASLDRVAVAAIGAGFVLSDALGQSVVAAVLLFGVLGLAATWVSWWRTTYWFDDDGDLRIASGLLQRTERRVQLSRLQSVEVVQPLIARLVGLAEVRPEMAGGAGSNRPLRFLAEPQARQMRAELLARAAGIRTDGTTPAPEAPERPLLRVRDGDLLLSSVLDIGLVIGTVVAIAAIGFAFITGQWAALFGVIIGGFAISAGTIGRFLTFYGFTIAESPDGLRLRHGLLTTQSRTVPPGRVQAVQLEQPLLWRMRGWVRVSVNVAGVVGEQSSSGGVLLPVADAAEARAVLSRILIGVDVESLPLIAAPDAARWRSPLQARRLAVGQDPLVYAARSGWLTERIAVVPHARTQSVRITQGPWQRALSLASVHVDSTPGPVDTSARQRSAATVRALAEEQVRLARAARSTSAPEHWMRPRPATGTGEEQL